MRHSTSGSDRESTADDPSDSPSANPAADATTACEEAGAVSRCWHLILTSLHDPTRLLCDA